MSSRSERLLLLACALVAGACSGRALEPSGAGDGDGPNACGEVATPLRRLSHVEYANTLRALLPGVELPALSLPEDQKPHEFDNDADALTPSTLLVERYGAIAREVAERAVSTTPGLVPCQPADASQWDACGRQFVRGFGARVFRRPLTDDEVETYSALYRDGPADATFAERTRLTLQLLLVAPEFLYRFEAPDPADPARLHPYAIASRLSYTLWATMPDDELLAAAADGRLATDAGVRAQAERMLDDDRAREAFVRFHGQWLDFDRLERVSKKAEDGFDEALRASMREESRRFVENILFEGDGTLADLLTSRRTFVDARLAGLYGVELPAGMAWAEVETENRAGFLTQATFLASHGHPDKPSPVLRGVFVLERLLCAELGAPPPNAEAMGAAIADEVEGPLTNREIYGLMTASDACQACHSRINPAGFAFEAYDTMGRYRTVEAGTGLPVDTAASFDDWRFADAEELAAQLAASPVVERCVVRKWLRYSFGGSEMERQSCVQDDLQAALAGAHGSLRALVLAVVTHPSFVMYVEGA